MNKKPTYGHYDATGIVKGLGVDSIVLDAKGKNNINWIMNKLNIRLDDNGNSFFLNTADGYDAIKGKIIYARTEDKKSLKIPFADRFNEIVLGQVGQNSFIRVGYGIGEIEKDGKKMNTWLYKDFLTEYDLIRYLKDTLQNDMKVTFSGGITYQTYNNETQMRFSIQRVYIEPANLPEDWTPRELGFNFRQTLLLSSDSLDDSEFEETGVAKVKAYIYTLNNKKDSKGNIVKIKNEEGNMVNDKTPMVYPIDCVVRATDDKKDITRKVIDKYLKITDEDTVRRITYAGKFVQGYVGGQITKDDLNEEMREMIELELYTLEEALKMSASKERISEKQLIKPDIVRVDNKPTTDIDDKMYSREDLLFIDESDEIEVANDTKVEDDSDDLLAELEGL